MCKWLIERDDANAGGVLDHDFISRYTSGFREFAGFCRSAEWKDIEQRPRYLERA
jgi:hypothetical protein